MGCTYEFQNCGATTTVVSQSTALSLLCGCTEDGEPMEYVGNTDTVYVGHNKERDYELRQS